MPLSMIGNNDREVSKVVRENLDFCWTQKDLAALTNDAAVEALSKRTIGISDAVHASSYSIDYAKGQNLAFTNATGFCIRYGDTACNPNWSTRRNYNALVFENMRMPKKYRLKLYWNSSAYRIAGVYGWFQMDINTPEEWAAQTRGNKASPNLVQFFWHTGHVDSANCIIRFPYAANNKNIPLNTKYSGDWTVEVDWSKVPDKYKDRDDLFIGVCMPEGYWDCSNTHGNAWTPFLQHLEMTF